MVIEKGTAGSHQVGLRDAITKWNNRGVSHCWRREVGQNLLKRIHAKAFVQAGAVAKECGKKSLEEQTKVEDVVAA